ncbi:chain-length determining protein [Aureimonas sp. SA4125]|uniref:GumC family protein n=1 Tax=Aureimonas sp. SA4125 TaxID=2826993 RepID=UPI001CC7F9EB|nr:GumC family protein [Aureimonas sp. SA4125]BDA84086.1 chain-length determining protein [Aureimonas sp. SA4125]
MSKVGQDHNDVDVDIGRLTSALWARKLTVLLSTVAFAGAGFAVATLLPSSYQAETQIVIEARESAFTRSDASTNAAEGTLSPESVESQVSLMTSAEILGDVAEKFKLATLAEFSPSPSLLDRLVTRVRPEADSLPGEVIEKMREKLQVYRKENQRVLVIEFSSHDPLLARDIPNAIATEYLSRQKGALLTSNNNATGWLEQEIADLQTSVKDAEGKVAAYRAQSDLLVGQNQSVLATQQLSEIATELSRTRAARAAAESRANSVQDAIERGIALDTVSEVLASPTVQALREREVALKAEIADLSTTLLENHPRLRSLRSQRRDLDTEIAREAAKVRASLETEADAARQREAALTAEMEQLKIDSAKAGSQAVELRSLEREAESQSQLLESYMTRYREAIARGSRDYLPVDARVFSQAQLPAEPYFPKVLPITAAAGVAGFLFSAIALLLRELFSGRALTPSPLPRRNETLVDAPVTVAPTTMPPAPPAPASSLTNAAELGEALLKSEVPRVLIVSADAQGRPAGVILARELAAHDRSTILVDLTPNSAAARAMGVPEDNMSGHDLADGTASFADLIHRDLRTSAHVMSSSGLALTDDASFEEVNVVLEALGKVYDCTMVDCGFLPPEKLLRLMDGTAALIVAVEPGKEASGEAMMQELADAGLGDVVLMNLGAPDDIAERRHAA